MVKKPTSRVIPLTALRPPARPLPALAANPAENFPVNGQLTDQRGRPLRDLRISVTDRCNFRCSYCMPKDVFHADYPYLPHSELLSFEEITRLARQFVAHGVKKIRLTGGEPLLRRNIEILVAQLAALRGHDDKPLDLALTTNGSLLQRKAQSLRDAGLRRITVSLDALDDTVFQRMNNAEFPVHEVLRGIEAAQQAGFENIKINMVVQRGVNDDQVLPMARHFRGSGLVLRFIEYMDVGNSNGWRMDHVLPSGELIDRLQSELRLVRLPASAKGETAQRWGYAGSDGQHLNDAGEIGVISSVTQSFCGDCNRARLSTEGRIYLCLFAEAGHDLREILRGGASDTELAAAIGQLWRQRNDRYSELRSQIQSERSASGAPVQPRPEMSYIGG